MRRIQGNGIGVAALFLSLLLIVLAVSFVFTGNIINRDVDDQAPVGGRSEVVGVDASAQKKALDYSWKRYSQNPLLSTEESSLWENVAVVGPRILKHSDGNIYQDDLGRYYLYYVGATYDYDASGRPVISFDQTGLAFSEDLLSWERYTGNPVVRAGPQSADYDHGDVQVGSVLVHDGLFRMWYNANAKNRNQGGDNVTIGYAESFDGITWMKHEAPVLVQGQGGDAQDLYFPIVLYDRGIYRMWYAGHNDSGALRIMYAASFDGVTWYKYGDAYVFDPGYNVFPFEVYYENGVYHLLFTNWDPALNPVEIFLATSVNGYDWIYERKIFSVGEEGAWDDDLVYWPSQVYANEQWYTFYAGADENVPRWSIGVATSEYRLPVENARI